jgi:CDP-glucose 4,6-dehydratase
MGKDPYSASKVGTEQAVSAWRQISKISGGPKVISVRAGNVIGGGDVSVDRLLPDLIRAISKDAKVTIRNPKSTRPWQHVLDPLVGYLQTADYVLKGNDVRAVNFSNTSSSLTVMEVLEIAARHLGMSVESLANLNLEAADESEAGVLDLDPALAQSLLGWKSNWTQHEAVVSTIDWWTSVIKKEKTARESCLADLELLNRKFSG